MNKLKKTPQRITKIKPHIHIYITGKGIKYPLEKDDWKKFETIALNILYTKKENKYLLPTFQNITQSMKN